MLQFELQKADGFPLVFYLVVPGLLDLGQQRIIRAEV
jgi:hypothetical protein